MNLVNVIIPVFNCADVLKETVTSIQRSGLRDALIILVDDGSTDRTQAVCENLLREYENIRYLRQENKGVSAARNRGIEASDSEYLLFFDADDSVDANAFQEACEILVERKPDMLIFGMCFDFYSKGKIYRTDKIFYPRESNHSQEDIRQNFSELYEYNALTSSCNKFIRRALIMDNHLRYPEDLFLMEDFLFSLDCVEKCESVYMLPQVIYRYRQTEDGGNVYRRMERIESLAEYVKPFRLRLEDHPDVFRKMCFMLLRQKLWTANPKQIQKISEDFLSLNLEPASSQDLVLWMDMKKGRYWKIYISNKKTQVRHRIAVWAKSRHLYR